jgi:hypothetical protein
MTADRSFKFAVCRSLWHMQLDSSRNHIIMVNLWLSMLNISVMASTIFPAYFGE